MSQDSRLLLLEYLLAYLRVALEEVEVDLSCFDLSAAEEVALEAHSRDSSSVG